MEESKLKTKEYNKQYYEQNKGRLSTVAREKVTCPNCKKQIAKDYLHKHQHTKQCQNHIFKKENEIKNINEFISMMNKKYNTEVSLFPEV